MWLRSHWVFMTLAVLLGAACAVVPCAPGTRGEVQILVTRPLADASSQGEVLLPKGSLLVGSVAGSLTPRRFTRVTIDLK